MHSHPYSLYAAATSHSIIYIAHIYLIIIIGLSIKVNSTGIISRCRKGGIFVTFLTSIKIAQTLTFIVGESIMPIGNSRKWLVGSLFSLLACVIIATASWAADEAPSGESLQPVPAAARNAPAFRRIQSRSFRDQSSLRRLASPQRRKKNAVPSAACRFAALRDGFGFAPMRLCGGPTAPICRPW